MKNLLGGKGANLAEMSNLGLPVPPGFTITTEVCTYYYAHGETYPRRSEGRRSRRRWRRSASSPDGKLGDPARPLLVSVRSGARVSMPGMMDTVLNLGLNAETTEGLAKLTGNPRFAYDSYRRFIQMYSDVVLGRGACAVRGNSRRREGKQGRRTRHRTRCRRSEAHRRRCSRRGCRRNWASRFPTTCTSSFGARSARCSARGRAIARNTYRRLHNIPEDWGTAVNVQAMVFGNRGETSAPPASPSRAIRRPARSCSTANS